MHPRLLVSLSLLFITLPGCGQHPLAAQQGAPCSTEWYQAVEAKVITGDGQGHGPDIGTDEWRSTIEFKLGIRGLSVIPPRESAEWCMYIDALVFDKANN